MDVYLVGGAVRDQLLNRKVKERDWVVVGATPEQLRHLGYRQVGKDFPVFLHPETGEEYALARTERKSGTGYYGFQCDFNPNVSLEEDLLRRDLTINAMALSQTGELFDPYGGQNDLAAKRLRHVSLAFSEDPVRVLRLARFAARFQPLGFAVAEETRQLCYAMVKQGELKHLIAERVWQEWSRSFLEEKPEQFILTLRACGALREVLPEVDALFGVPNPKHHHPEVDSGIHSLASLQAATVLSLRPEVRFAALVHDLGKAQTNPLEWPHHRGHEELGVDCIRALSLRLKIPAAYRDFAMMVSFFHLNIHRLDELRADTKVRILEQTDAFRQPERFEALLQVCEADALGAEKTSYPQRENWRLVFKACCKVTAQMMMAKGHQGPGIKQALHEARIAAIKEMKNEKL